MPNLGSIIKGSCSKYFGGIILLHANINAVVVLINVFPNLWFIIYVGSYYHSFGTYKLFLNNNIATVLPFLSYNVGSCCHYYGGIIYLFASSCAIVILFFSSNIKGLC